MIGAGNPWPGRGNEGIMGRLDEASIGRDA